MEIKIAHSLKTNTKDNAAELKEILGDSNFKMVIYFSSSIFDGNLLTEEMKKLFPDSQLVGCTTSGEIISGKVLKNSVVAMGLTEEIIEDVKISVMENISQSTDVQPIIDEFSNYYNASLKELDPSKYFGLILMDGLSVVEEQIMDSLGTKSNLIFIGASAGDDLKFEKTVVFANGKVYTNSAVFVVIKAKNEFDFIKTQSFNTTNKKLIPTKVDEKNRQVLEFNNEKATVEYAKTIGVDVNKAADNFMKHPVGLMVGDEPYVRSPQMIVDDSIKFYCSVKEGMELEVLESTDIISDTKNAIEAIDGIKGIINFNCILRTLELEAKEKTSDYGELFTNIPTVGFSTYGEAFIGHINQTATMLVLK